MMSDKSSDNLATEALFRIYDQLASDTAQVRLTSQRLPPVFFAVGAALLGYGKAPGIIFGMPYAIFFLGIWLAFIHAMGNGVGLHGLEVEQKINGRLGLRGEERLAFFKRFLEGRLEEVKPYFYVLGGFSTVTLLFCFIGACFMIKTTPPFIDVFLKSLVILFPSVLILSVLRLVIKANKKT